MPLRILFIGLLLVALPARGEPLPAKVSERYRQMLERNPVEGTALERLWKSYADAGQSAELLAEYQRAGTFASEMVLGHLLRKAGRQDEAAPAYERATLLDPKSALPRLALARLRSEEKQPAQAATEYEKAALLLPENDPQRVETLLQLGAAWMAAGDAAKAAEAWERTVALDPRNLDLRRRLAESYARTELADRAIEHLNYLQAHAPPAERAQAGQQLARIHQRAGNQDAAIRALEQALAGTAPGNWLRADLQSQLIRLHQRYHRVPELEERWKKAAAESPRDIAVHLQLIDLYDRLGDSEQQCVWLEKLTLLAPKNVEFRLRLARLYTQNDQSDRAAASYDQLLKEQPGNAEFVFERARLEVQREQPDSARARIAALLLRGKNDGGLRERAAEFFTTHRLHAALEAHLKEDAESGADEPIFALANFYFDQKREAEAQQTLSRLVRDGQSPVTEAAAHFQIAQVLKGRNLLGAAVVAAEKAIAVQPGVREHHLLLGDLGTAQGRYADARTTYENAFALSSKPAEALEADQKIFESIRVQASPSATGESSKPPGRDAASRTIKGGALEEYILNLTRTAAAGATAGAWLRVARWQLWNRNPRVAHECARQALVLEPSSLEAHEFIVKISAADAQKAVALAHLEELIKLDPARRAGYLRSAGQIELQSGRVTEALRVFQELVESSPGNVEALTDLALTQQRAERWEEARASWQQVYALSPAPRRKEAASALLRIYERLGEPRKSSALLLEQLDAQADETEKAALFQELIAHCSKHRLLDWLRGEFEQRRKKDAEDYFTEASLSRILKAEGQKVAAFEVLADASFAAPDPGKALPELVREAEELHRLDAAIRLQTQLVRLVPQTQSQALEKLAHLQEKNFALEEAARTWERLIAKFPREVGVLQRAVDFHRKWGAPARAAETLRRIRTLDPGNLPALTALAQLDLETGATAEAEACLEEILRQSPPEQPGDPIRFPGIKTQDSARLQNSYLETIRRRHAEASSATMRALRTFWVEGPRTASVERDLRLQAIRDLAQLVAAKNDRAVLSRWVDRWRQQIALPTEMLWALYHAGAIDAVLEQTEKLLTIREGDPQLKQGFIWLSLQAGQVERLSGWLRDPRRTPADRDFLAVAMGQHLQINGRRLEASVIMRFFPHGFRSRLWDAAQLFSRRGLFSEATALGERVFEETPGPRSGYGVELAHWHLYAGDIEKARRILRDSLGTAGESFAAPVYTALREYLLLLPEQERAACAEAFLRSIDATAQPLHAALSGVLLGGLTMNETAAKEQMRRLLELGALSHFEGEESGNSGTRFWDFILNTGAQLQSWKLDSLAVSLWEQALSDPALIRLQAETHGDPVQTRAAEVRARLAALQIARATSAEADDLIARFAPSRAAEALISLSEALENIGAHPRSIAIYRELWERTPANPHALRNLLSACRLGEDLETLEQILGRCVADGLFRANDSTQRDLTLQLVDVLEKRGALADAQTALEKVLGTAPKDPRLLLRLAQLQERLGRSEAAVIAFRRTLVFEPGNPVARLALASLLEKQEDLPAAIDALEKGTGTEVEMKLAQLYLKAGRRDEGFATLERLPVPSHAEASLRVAGRLAGQGELKHARAVLRIALSRAHSDARFAFPLQAKLIELLSPADDRAASLRELRRLRQMAGDASDLLVGYYDLALVHMPRIGLAAEFLRELAGEWRSGEGSLAAGVALLEWHLGRSEWSAAETVCRKLLARNDATEAVVQKMAIALEKAQQPKLAIEARARLARLVPLEAGRMLDWARGLHRLGQADAALQVLQELSWRSVLNDENAARIAQTCVEFGALDRALPYFRQHVRDDPRARHFRVHLDYARLLIKERDFAGAQKILRLAFRNPANREFQEIVAWIEAAGRLEQFDRELAGFALDPPGNIAARRAFFAFLEKHGDAARASALLDEHPEIIQPGIMARMRMLGKMNEDFARAAVVLEKLESQGESRDPALRSELAALYGDWAESELAELRVDSAVTHFQRGHELQPASFAIAQRLSELYAQRGEPRQARQVLERFLAASKSAQEIDKARQILRGLKVT